MSTLKVQIGVTAILKIVMPYFNEMQYYLMKFCIL